MKHALLLYKMDREDSWLINPIAIPLDREYKTFQEALTSIKTKVEDNFELQSYIMKRFHIKNLIEEEYREEGLSIQFMEMNCSNRPTFIFGVEDETGETLDNFELKLEPEFIVVFE